MFLVRACCISLCVLVFLFISILHRSLHTFCHLGHSVFMFCTISYCVLSHWNAHDFPVCLLLKQAYFFSTGMNCTCVLTSFSTIRNVFPLYTCFLCCLTLQFTEVVGLESKPLSLFCSSLPSPFQNSWTDWCVLPLLSSSL